MRRAFTRVPQQRPLSIFLFFLCVFSGCTYALDVHSHRLTGDTRAVHHVVSWCRCTVHLPAAPHPSRNPGLGLAGTPLSQARVFSAADLCRAGLPAHLAGHSRRILPQQLRSRDGRDLWIGTLARLRDVWRGSAAVVYRRVIFEAVWSLGEELGWRGFLFPRLQQRFGFHGACLISGLIWAVWHYPEILWTDFKAGTNAVFASLASR